MRRREFIVGGATIVFPLVARAQQLAMPVIGVLNSGKEQLRPDQFDGLHRGLKEAGFIKPARTLPSSIVARTINTNVCQA